MKKIYFILLLIICTTQIGLGIMFGMEKINFHVDEVYTFGLSNNTTGTVMSIPEGQLIDRSVLDKYVTVDLDNRFDYSNVWINQAADVHPPFYYALIHTICSFFPGKFMMMGGIGLNIIFSVMITLFIYFIAKELTHNNILAILISAAWSVSLGNMSFIVFIRMYMMLTALMLAIVLLHINYLHKKLTARFYLGVIVLSVLGTLTQYYFLIYLFFLCLIFGIHLLLDRRFKSAILYILSLSGAGIGAICIFPKMLYHIFGGYRGEESFQNAGNTSDVLERFTGYYDIINKELFANTLPILAAIILLLLVIYIIRKRTKTNWAAAIFSSYGLLLFPSLLYFLIVSKISVYITDRYIMPIFPMLLISIILAVSYLSSQLFNKNFIGLLSACFFILLSIIGLALNSNLDYLYKETAPAVQFAADNKDSDVLVIYTGEWRLNSVYQELIQYNHTRIIPKKKLANFKDTIDNYNDVIVYIIGNNFENTLEDLMSMNPDWNNCTLEYSSQYSHVYCLGN